MKKICAVLVTGVFLLSSMKVSVAQDMGHIKPKIIKPYPLAITYAKTTNIVFPYSIKSVDRGSKEVLAQKAKGTQNILQVKAGKQGFSETNLTVITADGKLYSFLLHYTDHPTILNLKFKKHQPNRQDKFYSSKKNQAQIATYAKKAFGQRKTVRLDRDKKYGMDFRMTGLFIHKDVMYFRLKIENRSAINYTIDQLRFFIRDKRKAKRTASQEIEIKPIYIYNNTSTIKGEMEHTLVVALSKFTIPNKKYLTIQLMEKNGGRHLELCLKNKMADKMIPIY